MYVDSTWALYHILPQDARLHWTILWFMVIICDVWLVFLEEWINCDFSCWVSSSRLFCLVQLEAALLIGRRYMMLIELQCCQPRSAFVYFRCCWECLWWKRYTILLKEMLIEILWLWFVERSLFLIDCLPRWFCVSQICSVILLCVCFFYCLGDEFVMQYPVGGFFKV